MVKPVIRLWKSLRYIRLQSYALSNAGLIFFETKNGKEISFYIEDLEKCKELYFGGFDSPALNVGEKVGVYYISHTQSEMGLSDKDAIIWVFKGMDVYSFQRTMRAT